MSKHKQFRSPSIGAFVTAVAASLQGIDHLPTEDRTASSALRLLNYVVSWMEKNLDPRLHRNDERDLKTLVAGLRAAVEGRDKWMEIPSPPEKVIH